jgi:hypothetical protein
MDPPRRKPPQLQRLGVDEHLIRQHAEVTHGFGIDVKDVSQEEE